MISSTSFQGHAAPVLYAVWAETGYLKENELLNLRKVDSILEGHPVPVRNLKVLFSDNFPAL